MHAATGAVPSHVPPELVEESALVMGAWIEENPFDTIVPQACEREVTYATNVVPGGRGGAWLFRRNQVLREIYMDTEHFVNHGFGGFAQFIGEDWSLVPAEIDPPEHGRYRALLNPLFSPPAMARMEDDIRHRARRLVEGFKERGECELMNDFAFPFPVSVVLDLMDLPQEKMDKFQRWEHMLLHSGDLAVMQEGTRNVVGYLREVIDERKRKPGNDLISHAITAELPGAAKMNDGELLGYAFNLFIGGLDTVSANIGNQVRHLASHPEHQRQLRENPAMIGSAVEEFMRAFAAVTTMRTCVKEKTIGGVTVKPGDMIAMCTTLAGRDATAFERPHDVVLDRKASHVSFAIGPHFCLGIHLARREMRVALEELLALLPEFRIREGAKILSQAGGIIQPQSLPLVWR